LSTKSDKNAKNTDFFAFFSLTLPISPVSFRQGLRIAKKLHGKISSEALWGAKLCIG
jgi:hypothetical protein